MEELKINKNTLEYGNLMDLIHTVSQMTDAEWKMYSSENNLPYEKSEYITILKNKEDDLNEASTTSGVGSYNTPFAFSKKSGGNIKAAKQLGYKLAKKLDKNDNLKETKLTKIFEKVRLIKEAAENPDIASTGDEEKVMDLSVDYSEFDKQLKTSTEKIKSQFEEIMKNKLVGKKITARSSKGYKQPEADYSINVTDVDLDYYYDRYVIVVSGREENKQKTTKFFIKPGFKIKVLGNADNLPNDRTDNLPAKEPSNVPANTVTSVDEPVPEPEDQPDATDPNIDMEPTSQDQTAPEQEPEQEPNQNEPEQGMEPDPRRKLRPRPRPLRR